LIDNQPLRRIMMALSYCPIDTALDDVRDQLSENRRVVLTEHGQPVAVMLSIDDYRSMQATIALANDPKQLQHVLDRAEAMSAMSETFADAAVRQG
jgi:prevent-host-death family protein